MQKYVHLKLHFRRSFSPNGQKRTKSQKAISLPATGGGVKGYSDDSKMKKKRKNIPKRRRWCEERKEWKSSTIQATVLQIANVAEVCWGKIAFCCKKIIVKNYKFM